jgi:hypothetical protein
MYLKIFLAVFSFFTGFTAIAQPVTGVWRGRITTGQGMRVSSAPVEIKLVAKGDSIVGTTYYYGSGKGYIRYSLRGYFDLADGSVKWQDYKMVQMVAKKVKTVEAYDETMKYRADYSCPDGKTLLLNGFCQLPDAPEMKLELKKVNESYFPDEWDEVIEGFYNGMNRREVIDSVWMIASVPSVPKAPTTSIGGDVAARNPDALPVDTVKASASDVAVVVPNPPPVISKATSTSDPAKNETMVVTVETPPNPTQADSASANIAKAETAREELNRESKTPPTVSKPAPARPAAPVDITAEIAKANEMERRKAAPPTPPPASVPVTGVPVTAGVPAQSQTSAPAANPLPVVQAPVMADAFNSRKKVIQTEIPVAGDSLELRFYDNAEVDGDSISLFLNGVALFQHVKLEGKAYIFKIPVKDLPAISELTMVAENLGAIPPNTAYMEAIVDMQRYSARLESTEVTSGVVRLVKKE